MSKTALDKSLLAIAQSLAERVKRDQELPLGEQTLTIPDLTNAFRALTQYWAVKNKVAPPDRETKGIFDEYSHKIDRAGAGARGAANTLTALADTDDLN